MQDALQGYERGLVRAPQGLELEKNENYPPLFSKKIKNERGGYLCSKCQTRESTEFWIILISFIIPFIYGLLVSLLNCRYIIGKHAAEVIYDYKVQNMFSDWLIDWKNVICELYLQTVKMSCILVNMLMG